MLTTAHLADACIRAQIPVRCAPAYMHAVVPGSRLAGRVVLVVDNGGPAFSLGAIPTGPQRLDVRPHGAVESATVGDWTVSRADLVLGDDDGLLVVPITRTGDIVTLAETIRDTERRQAERIRAGVSLRNQLQFDTYLTHRQQLPSLSFRDHLRTMGGAIEE